jgi:hypothetical protein
MGPEIDESSAEYREFLAWKASNASKGSSPEGSQAASGDISPGVVDVSKPLTDTEARKVSEGAETIGDPADAVPVDPSSVPKAPPAQDKPLTDTEARRSVQAFDEAGVTAPGAKTAPLYEFSIGELVKRDGPVPGTKTYGLVVKLAPMPTPTPDGTVLPGYVVASLGLTNEVLSTSQDLGLEKL